VPVEVPARVVEWTPFRVLIADAQRFILGLLREIRGRWARIVRHLPVIVLARHSGAGATKATASVDGVGSSRTAEQTAENDDLAGELARTLCGSRHRLRDQCLQAAVLGHQHLERRSGRALGRRDVAAQLIGGFARTV